MNTGTSFFVYMLLVLGAGCVSTLEVEPVISPEPLTGYRKSVRLDQLKMSYLELPGRSDTVLFVHGSETSSYLWRGIVPQISSAGYRVLAPDLIGTGESDRLPANYSYILHAQYLGKFVNAVGPEKVHLVLHGWGCAIGFRFAHKHPTRVASITIVEGLCSPVTSEEFGWLTTKIVAWYRSTESYARKVIEDPDHGPDTIQNLSLRELSQVELDHYAKSIDGDSLLRFARGIPINGQPTANHDLMAESYHVVRRSPVRKLLFWANPGFMIPDPVRVRYEQELSQLQSVYLGPGLHFLPESYPDQIAAGIRNFLERLPGQSSPPIASISGFLRRE